MLLAGLGKVFAIKKRALMEPLLTGLNFNMRLGTGKGGEACHVDIPLLAAAGATLPAVGWNCSSVVPCLSLILSQELLSWRQWHLCCSLRTRVQHFRSCATSGPCLCSFLGERFQQLPRGSDKMRRKPDKSCCMTPVGEMSMLRIVVWSVPQRGYF